MTGNLKQILARPNEVQEELFPFPGVGVGVREKLKFLCDGQGLDRRAILSVTGLIYQCGLL